MVCLRCKMAVETVLQEVGVSYESVDLGEVILKEAPTEQLFSVFKERIEAIGFELLDDQKKLMIEKTKISLRELVQGGEIDEHFSLIEYVTKHIYREYSTVSKLFTQLEGITLEQFFILQKIEKTKEWLAYNEYSLSEISYKLGYSSMAYLSNQFKKITGLTPTAFKANHAGLRKGIDDVIQPTK